MSKLQIVEVAVTLPVVRLQKIVNGIAITPEQERAEAEERKKESDREQRAYWERYRERQKLRDREKAANADKERKILALIPSDVVSMEEELQACRKENETLKLKVELLKRLLEEARAEAKAEVAR